MAPERTILDGATVVTMDADRTEHTAGHESEWNRAGLKATLTTMVPSLGTRSLQAIDEAIADVKHDVATERARRRRAEGDLAGGGAAEVFGDDIV